MSRSSIIMQIPGLIHALICKMLCSFIQQGDIFHVGHCRINHSMERIVSVVECLTRDRGAAGSSLTGITALCP